MADLRVYEHAIEAIVLPPADIRVYEHTITAIVLPPSDLRVYEFALSAIVPFSEITPVPPAAGAYQLVLSIM